MGDAPDYAEAQFSRGLKETLKKLLAKPAVRPELQKPTAVLLGGQSGAGKTMLHRIASDEVEGNAIIINGDEYRHSHPNFNRIQEQYGADAPAHTARWSGQMTEALVDALSRQRYNLIIEGTLRTSDVPLQTAGFLRNRGYGVSLAVMAVKPEISLISCQIRHEMMRIAGTIPRATDPEHHDEIVRDIASNLDTLGQSGLFDDVRLFDRIGKCLYPSPEYATAGEALSHALFGLWTQAETGHYRYLQQKLETLRAE